MSEIIGDGSDFIRTGIEGHDQSELAVVGSISKAAAGITDNDPWKPERCCDEAIGTSTAGLQRIFEGIIHPSKCGIGMIGHVAFHAVTAVPLVAGGGGLCAVLFFFLQAVREAMAKTNRIRLRVMVCV